ncbi:MAG: acyl-CoA dehydrogenase family protein [Actinobacteria bacterium]|nr:acyl-CoA dehydrogenase family protein [Actinomycetota bacterium]
MNATLPDPNNPYSFDEYRATRDNVRFLADDPFLQRVIATYAPELTPAELADLDSFDQQVSGPWRAASDEIALPENAIRMRHFDAWNNRIDRIERPAALLEMEKEIYGEGMFSEDHDAWARFVKIFLLCELGETGINCAHCCTGGLVMILDKYGSGPELERINHHMKDGIDGDYAIASQFLSEIQGGSDVAANLVEARPQDDGTYRIHGTKFFCSAAHADYAIITAKPTDSSSVGVFVVPSWLPGDKERERRNGYRINKLKQKLGTKELPTAEITYDGAVAYPVGDLNRGLANIVGIVLSHSRFITGISAGATLTRMAREAEQYAQWRTAFGVRIDNFGLVARQLEDLKLTRERTTAASFKLQREILRLQGQTPSGTAADQEFERATFQLRLMIMLQKMVACDDSAKYSEVAMSVLGANGLMEDFSALPRLYRDAVVLAGAWEGPRNLLLTRVFMDMQQQAASYPTAELIDDLLPSTDPQIRAELAQEVTEILSQSLLGNDKQTIEACRRWDAWCTDFVHHYQDEALREVSG